MYAVFLVTGLISDGPWIVENLIYVVSSNILVINSTLGKNSWAFWCQVKTVYSTVWTSTLSRQQVVSSTFYRVSHSVTSKSKWLRGVEGSIILLNYTYRMTHWIVTNFNLLDGNLNDHLLPQFFFLWLLWDTKMRGFDCRPFFFTYTVPWGSVRLLVVL